MVSGNPVIHSGVSVGTQRPPFRRRSVPVLRANSKASHCEAVGRSMSPTRGSCGGSGQTARARVVISQQAFLAG